MKKFLLKVSVTLIILVLSALIFFKMKQTQIPQESNTNYSLETTYAMIKPDATSKGYIAAIKNKIQENGFTILQEKEMKLTKDQAEEFYAEHKEKSFFPELIEFMTSGDIVALELEKNNAVTEWRKLMGATNPSEAAEGTVRKEFGASKSQNAVHGSDSKESAERELYLIFGK
ncbi:MAG: Nucleoside diphosphate kinase [candidate division TM6 bacterium GW2011_GWF2_32_72]|nr:MAG: Nucleoside diphosphate kinase [candidate division TM6 bacterium GW2011_GWF2_32_72]